MIPSDLFPATYSISRERFRGSLGAILPRWPGAALTSVPLKTVPTEDLTLDWIEAPAAGHAEKLLVFTLGEHGVEAFVGSAMYGLFVEEYLPLLDPLTTSLLFIHALNPWGMQHTRRVNAANVDLNRSFVASPADLDPACNPDYRALDGLFNPRGPLPASFAADAGFWLRLLGALATRGAARLQRAVLLGQYHTPEGIYFGGSAPQPETRQVMALFRKWIPTSGNVVHLDMHTGYGPRLQMSVVTSEHEPRSSAALAAAFGYPRVVRADPDEFYSIQGDMIDTVYDLAQHAAPPPRIFAASFEFGTFGDTLPSVLRSLRVMTQENQIHRFGTRSPAAQARLAREFLEMFNPPDSAWRTKSLTDARAAFTGILRAEGFIK
jgi:hypothetical protein